MGAHARNPRLEFLAFDPITGTLKQARRIIYAYGKSSAKKTTVKSKNLFGQSFPNKLEFNHGSRGIYSRVKLV
jgi:hypothetical protein